MTERRRCTKKAEGVANESKSAIEVLQVCGCCSGRSVRRSWALFVGGGGDGRRRRMWRKCWMKSSQAWESYDASSYRNGPAVDCSCYTNGRVKVTDLRDAVTDDQT